MNGICWNNGVNYETVTTLEPIVNRTVNSMINTRILPTIICLIFIISSYSQGVGITTVAEPSVSTVGNLPSHLAKYSRYCK